MTAPTMKDIVDRLGDPGQENRAEEAAAQEQGGALELVGALSRNMAMRARIQRLESRIRNTHPEIAGELAEILKAGARQPVRRRQGKASGTQH